MQAQGFDMDRELQHGETCAKPMGPETTAAVPGISPKPIEDYSRFISHTSSNRQYSFPRVLIKCLETMPPDSVFLAGGLPNASSFPVRNVSLKLRDGSELDLGPELTAVSMQYGVTDGYKPLLQLLGDLVARYHAVDPERLAKYRLIVTPGAQDGISKAIEAILNEGDHVIIEDAMYPGTLAALAPVKPSYLLVEGDGDGMKPESLRRLLTPWSQGAAPGSAADVGRGRGVDDFIADESTAAVNNGVSVRQTRPPPPKLLVVCPSGGNPTGSCLTLERKVEIYRIAQEHDLLILEDDPYFFLQFREERIPSFLSMDVDGRVIRTDSFSKIVSAGMRLGFLIGPDPIVDRVVMHEQVTIVHPPGITQIILHKLLESWGWETFDAHVRGVRDFYWKQKDAMVECCRKYLSDLADWAEPRGGMFVWLRVRGVADTLKMCMEHGFEERIVVLPGSACCPYPERGSPFVRISYSLVTPDTMEKGIKRLRTVILRQLEAQRQGEC